MLAIGGRLFREYRKKGGELPEQLLKELNGWKGKVEKEISTILEGRISEVELSASIDAFFASAGMKMKLEPATRVELRQVVETDITGLISDHQSHCHRHLQQGTSHPSDPDRRHGQAGPGKGARDLP